MRATPAWLALALALAGPAAADVPARLDAGAPEAAELTARQDAALDSYDLPVGPFGPESHPVLPLEGRVVRSAWRVEEADETPEQVTAEYRERLAEMGFEPVFACRDRECGGFDFRFGVELLPAPGMLMDTGDVAQLSMQAPDGRFASVLASPVLGDLYIQTVMVEGRAREPLPPAEPETEAPEPGAGDTGPPAARPASVSPPEPRSEATAGPPSADLPLSEALRREGHAVIERLEFESAGAALSPASDAVLDRVAATLTDEADLAVAVVGHSDNVGALEPNVAISRRRAEAVRDALIARGIAPARLEAHGVGWLAPVASNLTEEGRRRNRRVELVLR